MPSWYVSGMRCWPRRREKKVNEQKMQSSGPLSQIHFFLSPYSSLLACEDDGNGGKFLEGYVPSALGTSHEESSKGP